MHHQWDEIESYGFVIFSHQFYYNLQYHTIRGNLATGILSNPPHIIVVVYVFI